MRWLLILFCLAIAAPFARAQSQENKLMERIMRPDMSLTYSGQNKAFAGTGLTAADRKFETKSFYPGDLALTKSFWGAKTFSSKSFAMEKYSRAKAMADVRANAEMAFASTEFPTHKSALIRSSPEANKKIETRDYAESRPFLVKGTRQKILSTQSHPLTIDEVRELLNKNK
jgi:hypothetical protein